jgi:membrane protease YdiL (CAAX protease family)
MTNATLSSASSTTGLPLDRQDRRDRQDRPAGLRLMVLLVAFTAAVGLRVVVGGASVSHSLPAALTFAGCLLILARSGGTRLQFRMGALIAGVAGGVVICLPVALAQLLAQRPLHDTAGLWLWALVVAVVAGAEEVFLRGTLYDAVSEVAGSRWAVGVAALAFGLLHVPLYGWHVLPLDGAVGVVLGMLRASTGTVVAPAVAHVIADYAGWFLR